ncbi:MAG: hypothetical protein D6758_02870 [Gammaproteobacteria bacterium]|nr:MAG: hypothetical protein D6758_02870 [Gammaproteobacteria bacterium]
MNGVNRIMAKVHHGNNLKLDAQTLRAAARGELGDRDPIRESLEQSRRERRASLTPRPAQGGGSAGSAVHPAKVPTVPRPKRAPEPAPAEAGQTVSHEAKQARLAELKSQRRQWLEILRLRDALEAVNDDLLAMREYPDNANMLIAKRKRDLWLLTLLLGLAVFLIGWMGFAPAWVAGTGFAVFVGAALTWVPPVRRLFSAAPTYEELRLLRKSLELRALGHLKALETREPLAWMCQALVPWNERLASPRYRRLVTLSRKRLLLRAVESAAAFRLYLEYMLEARKAMDRLEDALQALSEEIRELEHGSAD